MSFYARLDRLLKQKNISHNKLITTLGLTKNAMYNWKCRGNIPNGHILLKIAAYLDTSVDYLIGNGKYVNKHNFIVELNPEEQESQKFFVSEKTAHIIDKLSAYCDKKTSPDNKNGCKGCPFHHPGAEYTCFVMESGYGVPAYYAVYEEKETNNEKENCDYC